MTFQFQCPQGHLLEGDESQAHEQAHCPRCGMMFVVPAPSTLSQGGGAAPVSTVGATSSGPPKILHVPCPNGHVLDSPIEMLGQDVLCPHCEVQFHLREEDSLEYKRQQQLAQERAIELAEFEVGKMWLKWAIAVCVLVAAAVAMMIALSA